MPDLWVVRAPVLPYEWGLRFQRVLAAARHEGRIPDLLLLLEHTPVYTRGRRTRPEELPMGEDWYRAQGIEVCDTDRGGAVTYHGPGQLVGYPIVSLKPYGDDVHAYVRGLERTMIDSLGSYDIEAQTFEGLTGVWTAGLAPGQGEPGPEASKIGSIGIHISRGVTTHGLAVNVNNDLQPFEWIVPCGIEGARMTSISRELGAQQDLDGFAEELAHRYASIFERQYREIDFQDAVSQGAPMGESELSNAFAPLT
jgi:lipoyl(octanoyl) transferase